MRECCVWLNVGDESVSLLVFSVCADGSVVWYFWCPGCRVELRFLYCDDVRLCCEQYMFKFFHGAPLPFALSLRIFISLCFVLEVFCLLRVWGCVGLVWVLSGWRRMEVL